MRIERYIALALLAFCLGYGYVATGIRLLPFQAQDAVSARTMPYLLSFVGAVISLLMLVLPPAEGAEDDATEAARWRALDWRRAGLIMLAVIAYGVLIRPAGFIVSTLSFLFFCSYILGERRLHIIAAVHVPIVLGFWLVMTKLLSQSL